MHIPTSQSDCISLPAITEGTTWYGCGSHIPSVLDSVPESERCDCGPQVERNGKMYPPGGKLSSSCSSITLFLIFLTIPLRGPLIAHSRNPRRHFRRDDQGHVRLRRQEGRQWEGGVVIDEGRRCFFSHGLFLLLLRGEAGWAVISDGERPLRDQASSHTYARTSTEV